MREIIRISTRGSQLAMFQANKVKNELEQQFPGKRFELLVLKTQGDKILDVALSKIGDKGLFTKELENSLTDLSSDIAVHSLKDLPTILPEHLCLGGVLQRENFRDALVSKDGRKLSELTEKDVIATSSLRRKAQLWMLNPKFNIVEIRGNVDTRLQKMQNGFCDAMVMAAAGLIRLGLSDHITEIIDEDTVIPAVSQGAIAMEIRKDDPLVAEMVSKISHTETWKATEAERVFLRKMEGGCQIPIGCYTRIKDGDVEIFGFISNIDGSRYLKDSIKGKIEEANQKALELAERFIEAGAREILDEIRL
jgi:hydroxymethylbilane synthase